MILLILVKIDNWDFEWQGAYLFKKLLKVPAGSMIYAKGNYDNTVSPTNPNPVLSCNQDLILEDEMFVFIFQYLPYHQIGDENISIEDTSINTNTNTITINSSINKLLKISDFSGRKTPFKTNQPLLYIYEDGTVEKINNRLNNMSTYIIEAIRTPIGNFGGTLKNIRTDDLGAIPIRELIRRTGIDPKKIDDVILGCANQAGEDNRNIARMSLLLAGLPFTVPGETINRLCSSGMSSVIHAHRAICAGDGDLFIAGGVENMTRGPWVISKASKPFGRDAQMHDSSFGWRFINPKMKELYGVDGMGNTAENLAEKYKISREDQDKFAYHSQMKAKMLNVQGRLAEEIVSVEIPQRKKDPLIFQHDEFIKGDTSLEVLAKLRTAFKKEGGSVTAGNASGLNDGAAAMLLASEKGARKQPHSYCKNYKLSCSRCGAKNNGYRSSKGIKSP